MLPLSSSYTTSATHPKRSTSWTRSNEGAGYQLRCINYEGEIVPTDADTILAQPQEHWTLWLR